MVEHINKLVSAPFPCPNSWHEINWDRVNRSVKMMQNRIAKACKSGEWRRVRRLQRSLTRSPAARYLAIRRVTENQGNKTAGVDGRRWTTPAEKWKAAQVLKRRGYRALPLRRVFIPKPNGKQRPLGIPTIADRAMQALYMLALSPVAEAMADPNSYGFRPWRSTADAMGQLYCNLCRKRSARWVLEADIKGCFDHISHEWLIRNIPMDKDILQKWLRAGIINKGMFNATEEGTPQGGVISPVLANLALDGLETQLKKHLGVTRAKKSKVHVVRYADDFVITADTPELLEREIHPWVEEFLSHRGLELSPEKTRVISIHEGFDFLGWNFRKYGEKLLIKPAKKNIQAFYQRVRTIISRHGGSTQEKLIYRLAPVLRGWAQYHSHVVAKATFHRLDAKIWHLLWRWAKRNHSKKGRQWVRERYFHTIGNRNWEFACKADNTGAASDYIRLKPLSVTPIIRHKKIKSAFNPFDPIWEKEGESLRMQRMLHSLRYRREIAGLYRLQKEQCPHCMHPITQETGWQEHHLEHILHGGKNVLDNRVLLHPECHDQVHILSINLNKPARQTGLLKA